VFGESPALPFEPAAPQSAVRNRSVGKEAGERAPLAERFSELMFKLNQSSPSNLQNAR
jgi:hypothetical protein